MSEKINQLIKHLTKLNGIGPRQAMRLAIELSNWGKQDLEEFGDAVKEMKLGPIFCSQCFNFADRDLCRICSNLKRDKTKIAVIEKVTDLDALEKAKIFDGVYHVLGGVLNPSSSNSKLKIAELVNRVEKLKQSNKEIEVILATSSNTYGETTALFLRERLTPLGIKITRLAQGLSSGSLIEYSDEATLTNALKHRK